MDDAVPEPQTANPALLATLLDTLHDRFGLADFRLMQREVIESVLAGRDTLCVMPTGAGKSLCYQLPAVVQGGMTVVVSPLISLMEDQVRQLRARNIPAMFLNSSLPPGEQREVLNTIQDGFEGLLYVAPERFVQSGFQSLLSRVGVKLLAIDEAHCISQWGHDFRPEYSQLGPVRASIGNPPTVALTATATDDVRQDIVHLLHLVEPEVVVTGFDRLNLRYEARCLDKQGEKDEIVKHLLEQEPGSAIVYCSTRRGVEEVSADLARLLPGRPVFAYHAGMDSLTRSRNLEGFMQFSGAIAVATNAFGMGINKPDIRLVLHYDMPGTLEAYYQEAGRAGRDGGESNCVLLYHFGDRQTQEFFIDKIGEEGGDDPKWIEELKARARAKLNLMTRYARLGRCRRQQILDYFGDESTVVDCQCDVCRGSLVEAPVTEEVTLLIRQLLSGVARQNGKFGITAIAEMLAGVDNERAQRWRLKESSVFGLLRARSPKTIVGMLHRLVEAGLAQLNDPEGLRRPVISITAQGVAVMKATQPPPGFLSTLIPQGRTTRAARAASTDSQMPTELDAAGQALFDKLRIVRNDLARQHELPAYIICHDKTLREMALHRPGSLEALEEIRGMGPHKVRLYGQPFLDAIVTAASVGDKVSHA